jgi:glycine betaine/proline transport system ATP-binding protein
MGLSVSGKSTLLRAVNALAPVVRGDVQVFSGGKTTNPYKCNPQQLRNLRMHTVSMVFQQFALLPWRTVSENVGFGLELAGVPEAERKKRVDEQLELVNLAQWSSRKVQELSGGMQQRVGLARAFATGAPILLMDEPFSALDPLIRTRLQDELLEFQRRLKKTILFVSHDLDEAFRIGNRIAIMEGGRIVQCGTPQDIVRNPVNQYVADFVQNLNPINMLTAADVMRSGIDPAATVSGTAKPDARLVDVLDAMSRQPGVIGVVDNGVVIGAISAQDVVNGLTRHRNRT